MFAVLLGCGAMVIDVGSWYLGKRQAQAAADAGALAGAQFLPEDPGEAVAYAQSYVAKNLADAQATVTPGYAGDPLKVEVKIHITRPGFFSALFGIDSVDIGGRAVATRAPEQQPVAVFSYNSSCSSNDGLFISGNSQTIEGAIISNGRFDVSGGNNTASYATAGGPDDCSPHVSGTGNQFPIDETPDLHSDVVTWPAYFTQSSFVCDYSAANFSFAKSNTTIPAGVYCATKKISVSGNNLVGNVTFIAPDFSIATSGSVFTPYSNGVLWFDTGTREFNFSGSDNDWTGIIFAPFARINFSGSSFSSFSGMIEGLNVKMTGSSWSIKGTGPLVPTGNVELVE